MKYILSFLILLLLNSPVFAECIKNIPISYNTGNGWSQNETVQVSFLTELEIRNKHPYYSSDGTPSFYATIYISSGTRIIKIPSYEVVDAIFNCRTFNFFNDSYLYGIDNKGYSWRFNIAQIASSRNSSSNGYNESTPSNSDYQSPIDLNQHEATMAAFQAQRDKEKDYFNSLSAKDRASIIKYQDYQQQKEWVKWQVYGKTRNFISHNDKLNKNLIKESKVVNKKYEKRNHVDLTSLEDGWHEIIIYSKSGKTHINLKRHIKVENKNITAYIGGNNLIFYNPDFNTALGVNRLNLKEVGEEVIFYIPEKSLVRKPPKYETPITLILTTRANDNPEVYIFNNKIKYYFKELNKFRGSSSDINCNTTRNVIRVILPPGKYEYVVASDTKYWNNKFKLDSSKSCRILTFTD